MARKSPEHFSVLTATVVALVLWLVIPPLYQAWMREGFYEFQAPVWTGVSQIKDVQQFWSMSTDKNKLIEAGIDLSRRNAWYKHLSERNEALKREVKGLEGMLKLPPLPSYRVEVARVINRDVNAWWQEITIRKGKDFGIPVGAAVIYSEGIVGRVKSVGTTTAVVELVSSRGFRMAANFEGDSRPVTYQGSINSVLGNASGQVRDVPADIKARVGEPRRLVSSRLGGVFPDGLTLGLVTHLQPDTNGLFTEGSVKLPEDLVDIREVSVLIPLQVSASKRESKDASGYVF